jgi:hypothetical protein
MAIAFMTANFGFIIDGKAWNSKLLLKMQYFNTFLELATAFGAITGAFIASRINCF